MRNSVAGGQDIHLHIKTFLTNTYITRKASSQMTPPRGTALFQMPGTAMWVWCDPHTAWLRTPQAGISIDDLEIEGFMLFPVVSMEHHLPIYLMLQSQLLSSLLYSSAGREIACFTTPESIRHLPKKAPVLLGSLQETTTGVEHPHAYPPKEHGTVALILEKNEQHEYLINDLPPEAQERQKAISQLIDDMQSIPQQETFNVFIDSETEELRNMMQQLAEDYYQYHQSQVQKKRAVPHSPNTFESGFAETSACLPIQAVIASIQSAKSILALWENPKNHAPFFLYEKPKGTAIVEYKTGEKNEVFDDKTTASLWRQVKQFSDDDADVVLALFAHLIRPTESDGTAWFMASQYLDYRGIKPIMKADTPGGHKRRAGHRQEDIKAVGASIGRIENIWITLHQWIDETASGKKKKRKRTEYTHKGRLLMVEEAYTQRELPDGDKDGDPGMEIGWRIRPGSWLRTFLESPNRQVANLCQKSLQYDPYREQWEKRLSRYFMFHGHINTHGGGGVFNREIGKLLQEVSLEQNQRDPQRTRNRFEKAMNTLVEDKIIQEWEYAEEVSLPARGWLATWLEQRITVHIAPTKDLLKG